MTVPFLSGMLGDISGLIGQWGKRCVISRLSGTVTQAGRLSGTTKAVGSGTFWIQPVDIASQNRRSERGLDDRTTHVMVARITPSFRVEDRIAASGESYPYDVVAVEENPSHQWVQLARVKRT